MEAPEEDEQERLMHQQGNFVICKEEPDFQVIIHFFYSLDIEIAG